MNELILKAFLDLCDKTGLDPDRVLHVQECPDCELLDGWYAEGPSIRDGHLPRAEPQPGKPLLSEFYATLMENELRATSTYHRFWSKSD